MLQITKYLDILSPLILLLFVLYRGNIAFRRDYIFWFILFQTFINGISIIYDKVLLKDNLFLYHINCAFSFLILTIYFRSIFKIRKIRVFVSIISTLFFVFFVINLYFWENLQTFNSNSFGIASLIIITYCLLFYTEELLSLHTIHITASAHFWYVTGLLTYYAGSFIIFITYRYFIQNHIRFTGLLWQTHNVIFLLLCLYLYRGLICKPLQEKYSL
ncbi:hypothetical protein GXP67_05235 [Rhodocytophaga rosea]|uniref:Uncharacterized protein n=1 Tax=Rhodocytophaga rosea TaxID=2704465 RepID=A0A6C0GE60_9BACT|nr:hypothetical protein [Rhodocytophaga rosea]QHT66114.1 hypothetical protein GXP67_05235 [Rhodocytophaga rosea]